MSALVSLNSPKSRNYLNFIPHTGVELLPTEGQLLKVTGGVIESLSPAAYAIKLGVLSPRKYEAVFTPSAELTALGTVSCPTYIPVGDTTELVVTIRPFKKIDAGELESVKVVGLMGLLD